MPYLPNLCSTNCHCERRRPPEQREHEVGENPTNGDAKIVQAPYVIFLSGSFGQPLKDIKTVNGNDKKLQDPCNSIIRVRDAMFGARVAACCRSWIFW